MVGRRQTGEVKNSIGNVEAKELISMTHGHELQGGNVEGKEWAGWSLVGGWDNCNSIINKYIKNKKLKKKKTKQKMNYLKILKTS